VSLFLTPPIAYQIEEVANPPFVIEVGNGRFDAGHVTIDVDEHT
jgi:hypothetical protein